jgi:cytochrome b561
MQLTNTVNRYGFMAKLLHWLIAIIVITLLCVGLYMVGMKNGINKSKIFGLHKEFGLLVLFLATFRLTWRLCNITPVLPATIANWEKYAAHAVHWLLYGFLFAMPLTGWLLSSAAGFPPSFFGLFVLPSLIAPQPDLVDTLANVHSWLGFALIALISGHAAAALQHYFIEKDDVLQRML